MKSIQDQIPKLEKGDDSPLKKFLNFFKLNKLVGNSRQEDQSYRKGEKIKWEAKVLEKKIQIAEAKKAWDAKRKDSFKKLEPPQSSELTSELSQVITPQSSELTAELSQVIPPQSSELTSELSQVIPPQSSELTSELSKSISDNALSPSIFKQSSDQKAEE